MSPETFLGHDLNHIMHTFLSTSELCDDLCAHVIAAGYTGSLAVGKQSLQ